MFDMKLYKHLCLADDRFIFCSKRKKPINVEFLFGALGPRYRSQSYGIKCNRISWFFITIGISKTCLCLDMPRYANIDNIF